MAGGITTLTEKSLGCIHKAGSRPFDGCFEYGQWIDKKGLYFVNAAASDVLSVTALAAAGATLVAFTTGLGNPIGQSGHAGGEDYRQSRYGGGSLRNH